MTQPTADTPTTDTRRDLLKKAAVAGAVVWTAPTVLSLQSVAAAASGGGSCTQNCDAAIATTSNWTFTFGPVPNAITVEAANPGTWCTGCSPTDLIASTDLLPFDGGAFFGPYGVTETGFAIFMNGNFTPCDALGQSFSLDLTMSGSCGGQSLACCHNVTFRMTDCITPAFEVAAIGPCAPD